MGDTKEVKMDAKVNQDKGHPEKVSYEQMVNIANQLQSQNRELMIRLNNLADIYHRLDYLFKVVASPTLFSKEFIDKCVKEIEEIMTIPEQPSKPQPEEAAPKKD